MSSEDTHEDVNDRNNDNRDEHKFFARNKEGSMGRTNEGIERTDSEKTRER